MFLALGVVSAILEARTSGQGQVVDAAMVDGTAVLTTLFHAMRGAGLWSDEPGTNVLDSGAHFYEVYETADGGHVAVGALEPQFYAELLRLLELDAGRVPAVGRERWPEFKERFAAVFATRSRDEWAARLEPAEACATAVLGAARGAAASAQRRPRHVRGGRRPGAARARAALLAHARGDPAAPGRRAGRVGDRAGDARAAPRRRRDQDVTRAASTSRASAFTAFR